MRLRMPNGAARRLQLVGTAEAILGRRHGAVVDVLAPGGTQRIEILEIESRSGSALAA